MDSSDTNGTQMPLELEAAERLVLRLAPAVRAHEEWVHALNKRLVCGKGGKPVDGGDVPKGIDALEKWLLEEDDPFVVNHPHHADALRHLRQARDYADRFLQALDRGDAIAIADYECFATAISGLNTCIDSLIHDIWNLLRSIDPLTGITNRFAFLPRLQQELTLIRRTGRHCSVCMVDIDNFKTVNDTFGHRVGDTVLEIVSDYLARNLRRHDQVCRYGGEEFVLLLPNSRPETAKPVVDRLRRGLATLPIPVDDEKSITVTASFGIASLAADQPVAVSLDRADQAMYRAKRLGRNKVAIWREENGFSQQAVHE